MSLTHQSDYRDLYKNVNQLKEHQITRRLQLLKDQKQNRDDQFSFRRDLKEIFQSAASSQPNKHFRQRTNPFFKNNLMLSEWMMTRPEDTEDFFIVPCPKGVRCSVSTGENRYKTAVFYTKRGQKFLEVKSTLPAFTILDCVYNKESQIVYVLDVIAYGGRDLIDCDASFRFFWIKSKLLEDGPRFMDKNMKLKLDLVPAVDMSDSYAVRNSLQTFPIFSEGTELDGFLFYHKEGSYTSGETPLVLWLFPFMVDELFDEYRVNASYHSEKPAAYTDYLDYIKAFNEKHQKKHKHKKAEAMEHESDHANEPNCRDELQATIDLEMTGDDV